MYLSGIDNRLNIRTNNSAFGAKINLQSSGIAEYCEFLESCKDAPQGYFSSNRNIELFSKICKALEKHPSKEVIEAKALCIFGGFDVRGLFETKLGKIRDVEISRIDNDTGPMEYLFRKFLNPDNRMVFNGLMGEEYSTIYPKWWDENIKPIWNEINNLYRNDSNMQDNLSENEINSLFKKQFRKKENKEVSSLLVAKLNQIWKSFSNH